MTLAQQCISNGAIVGGNHFYRKRGVEIGLMTCGIAGKSSRFVVVDESTWLFPASLSMIEQESADGMENIILDVQTGFDDFDPSGWFRRPSRHKVS